MEKGGRSLLEHRHLLCRIRYMYCMSEIYWLANIEYFEFYTLEDTFFVWIISDIGSDIFTYSKIYIIAVSGIHL